ncbi:hypothetical protein CQW23_27554 [Capsicum baccatum]|uniref:Peptidase C1A papain C-terminal domain-containing protein n=1 Tax=Capsicum baccatum TaxID=33114 RepID=A0A2G2VE31_CAPBA|nr:hypothetical protein CQW23_27554 [Capsicum baccatum]PHT99876.1 hypothetical protein BC332_29664 [Capsicum chinense]
MVDLEIETVDAEMVDADVDPVAVVDAGVTDMAEMVDADADPVAVVDTGVTDMDVDSPADADGYGLGIEDYGRLISSFPSEALVSNFCSSRHMAPSGNQLDVDSCLAFTLCAALSFLVGLTCGDGQNTLEFSAQEMVDCIPIGVGGTKYALGYDYVQRKGLHLITDYPYTATYGTPCRNEKLAGCGGVKIVKSKGVEVVKSKGVKQSHRLRHLTFPGLECLNIYIEAKKQLVELLDNKNERTEVSSGQLHKSLGKILPFPVYDSAQARMGRLKYYFEGYVSIPPDLAPEALMYRPLTAGIPLYKSFEKFRTPHVSVEALMIYSKAPLLTTILLSAICYSSTQSNRVTEDDLDCNVVRVSR